MDFSRNCHEVVGIKIMSFENRIKQMAYKNCMYNDNTAWKLEYLKWWTEFQYNHSVIKLPIYEQKHVVERSCFVFASLNN
jgi:hypothetical protein